jgi:outer membrane protein OmpA-like peptidoglycan-associated protein
MSTSSDTSEKYILGFLAILVALVVTGVLVLSFTQTQKKHSHARRPQAGAQINGPIWPQRIIFDAHSSNLPESASEVLSLVAQKARGNMGSRVQIVPFQTADAPGQDAQKKLAVERAKNVRHGLEANGVSPQYMIITQPVLAPSSSTKLDARQVELSIQ